MRYDDVPTWIGLALSFLAGFGFSLFHIALSGLSALFAFFFFSFAFFSLAAFFFFGSTLFLSGLAFHRFCQRFGYRLFQLFLFFRR